MKRTESSRTASATAPGARRAALALLAFACAAAGCSKGAGSEPAKAPAAPEASDRHPAPSAACDGALACESFDAMPLGVAPTGVWAVNETGGGRVTVDATRAYSGSQAVLARTPATETPYKAALLGYQDPAVLPTSSNSHFGRMMVFLEAAPKEWVHWTFLAGAGRSEPQLGYADGKDYPEGFDVLYRYGGQKPIAGGSQLMASYETPGFYASPPAGPDTDCHQDSEAVPMPEGRWTCAEWHFDGASAEMRLWLDGVEVPGLHVSEKGARCRTLADELPWTPPSFKRVDVGWESYQPDDERSVWMDDFVLHTERVGCPAPR